MTVKNLNTYFGGGVYGLGGGPIGPSGNLGDLLDVLISTPTTGQSLVYNGVMWANRKLGWSEISGKPTVPVNLDDLADVDTAGVQPSYFLKWNGTKWISSPDVGARSLNELSDVDIVGVFSGRVLYEVGGGAWRAEYLSYNDLIDTPTIPTNDSLKFIELNDTVAPSLPNGFLKWNGAGTMIGYSILSTSDISNIATVASTGKISDLVDVDTTLATSGHTLMYDNVNMKWVAKSLSVLQISDSDYDTYISVSEIDDSVVIQGGPDSGDIYLRLGSVGSKVSVKGEGAALLSSDGITLQSTTDDIIFDSFTGTYNFKSPATDSVITAENDLVLASTSGNIVIQTNIWPNTDGTDGQVLSTDGAGGLQWITSTNYSPVSSVFGRQGDVLANVNDYSNFYASIAQGALADTSLQPTSSINNLSDVNTTGALSGYGLTWNGTNWVPSFVSTVTKLDNLSDVTISSNPAPVSGQALVYNGTRFVNGSISYNNIVDKPSFSVIGHTHVISDVIDLQTSLSNKAGKSTINNMDDVNITNMAPATNQVLTWDGTSSQWIRRNINDIALTTVSRIEDSNNETYIDTALVPGNIVFTTPVGGELIIDTKGDVTVIETDDDLTLVSVSGSIKLQGQAWPNLAGNLDQVLTVSSDGSLVWTDVSRVTTFIGLTDTPSAYTGNATKILAVNSGETGLEYVTINSVGAVSSVYGRTGVVVAELNDYTTDLIGNDSAVVGSTLTDAMDLLSSDKANKVVGATTGNFAGLDANGDLTDSGASVSTFATAAQGALADTALQPTDSIGDLADVDMTGVVADQVLAWNSDQNTWLPATPLSTIGELSDVNVANIAPETDQVLSWDDNTTTWVRRKLEEVIIPPVSRVQDAADETFIDTELVSGSIVLNTPVGGEIIIDTQGAASDIKSDGDLILSSVNGVIKIDTQGTASEIKSDGDLILSSDTGSIDLQGQTWPNTIGNTGQVLTVSSGTDLIWSDLTSTFLDLTDTPSDYTGNATKILAVNSGETGLEYVTINSVGAVSSVYGRTGGVIAELNDYTTDLIGNDSVVVGSTLTEAIDLLSSDKANKVVGATAGNFAGLDANGDLTDSGASVSTFATAAQGALADTALQPTDSIGDLADVDVTNITPENNQVLSWDDNTTMWVRRKLQDVALPPIGKIQDTADETFIDTELVSGSIVLNTPVGGEIIIDTQGAASDIKSDGDLILSSVNGVIKIDTQGATSDIKSDGDLILSSVNGVIKIDTQGTTSEIKSDGDLILSSDTGSIDLQGQTWPNTIGNTGQVLTVSSGTDLIWSDVSGGGVTTFIGLTDTPSDYTGNATKILAVNSGETGLEYVSKDTFGAVTSVYGRAGVVVAELNDYTTDLIGNDSAVVGSTLTQAIDLLSSDKANKVVGSTTGNFAGLDANGDITDSGTSVSTFATAAQGVLADTALQPTDSIGDLADVDLVTTPPTTGNTLSWNGSAWVPSAQSGSAANKIIDPDSDTYIDVSEIDDTIILQAGPDSGNIIMRAGASDSKVYIEGYLGGQTILSSQNLNLESTVGGLTLSSETGTFTMVSLSQAPTTTTISSDNDLSIQAASVTILENTWPLTDGTNGQVLATDGNGSLSWSDPGSIADGTITGAKLVADINLAGYPTTTTAPESDLSDKIATTAFVHSLIGGNPIKATSTEIIELTSGQVNVVTTTDLSLSNTFSIYGTNVDNSLLPSSAYTIVDASNLTLHNSYPAGTKLHIASAQTDFPIPDKSITSNNLVDNLTLPTGTTAATPSSSANNNLIATTEFVIQAITERNHQIIMKPYAVLPPPDGTISTGMPMLKCSEFIGLYSTEAHVSTRWRISRNIEMTDIVYDTGDTVTAYEHYITAPLPTSGIDYYWTVEHIASDTSSNVSNPTKFHYKAPIAYEFQHIVGLDQNAIYSGVFWINDRFIVLKQSPTNSSYHSLCVSYDGINWTETQTYRYFGQSPKLFQTANGDIVLFGHAYAGYSTNNMDFIFKDYNSVYFPVPGYGADYSPSLNMLAMCNYNSNSTYYGIYTGVADKSLSFGRRLSTFKPHSICWHSAESKFVCWNSLAAYTSTDGITWTGTTGLSIHAYGHYVDGTIYTMAAGTTASIKYSNDGVTWYEKVLPAGYPGCCTFIGMGNGIVLGAGRAATSVDSHVMVSYDSGNTWETCSVPDNGNMEAAGHFRTIAAYSPTLNKVIVVRDAGVSRAIIADTV